MSELGPLPDWDPEIAPSINGSSENVITDPREIVAQVRAYRVRLSDAEATRDGALAISERSIPSRGGRTVALTILKPAREPARGAIYWLHGFAQVGGTSVGPDIRTALDLAVKLSLVIVAAEFALAPEHPAPAGLEDAFAGFEWTVANATELGYPDGALFLHGLSGGAGLAAGTALLARDAGIDYAGLMLDGPMLDDRCSTVALAQAPTSAATLRIMWDHILNGAAGDDRDAVSYTAPGRFVGEDLSGLPPTYILSGSCDSFRDEATAFAEGIWRSGGTADLHQWAGVRHGADLLVPDAHVSRETVAGRTAWYDRILARLEASGTDLAAAATESSG